MYGIFQKSCSRIVYDSRYFQQDLVEFIKLREAYFHVAIPGGQWALGGP